jgi:orotate phosphoribosyltransferase
MPHAQIAAHILIETKSVLFQPQAPFTLTSGRVSPVYVDCRRLISFPRARRALMDMAVDLLAQRAGYEAFDAIAGGETAGIPFAAWIAERLALPMVYVRKQAKGFGRNAQIEGTFDEGDRVLLVEDLVTDGGSKLNFIRALRTAGAEVGHCFVIFHYGVYQQSSNALAAEGVRLHALATWHDVIMVAERQNYFPPRDLDEVRRFLTDPAAWSRAHGGREQAAAATPETEDGTAEDEF